jgi:hypothetical protein
MRFYGAGGWGTAVIATFPRLLWAIMASIVYRANTRHTASDLQLG